MYVNKTCKPVKFSRRKVVLFFSLLATFRASLIYGQASKKEVGRVTGFPIPRYVSAKSNKMNVRRGPGKDYKIDWIYKQKGNPFIITAEFGPWRRIEDFEGEGGWVHYSLISGVRHIIVLDQVLLLKRKPKINSSNIAQLNRGVVAKLLSSKSSWCAVQVGKYKGWLPTDSIWGLDKNEIF